MYIERLIIRKKTPCEEIIRDIVFNLKGLNLIIDSESENDIDSGNDVGKSTVVKVIDLCLGGKSVKTLYFDDDTKSENKQVKNFLKEFKVEAELTIINGESKHIIVKELFPNGKNYIDYIDLKNTEFKKTLKKYLFESSEEKPTLRQLMPKFIRLGENIDGKMIKFLYLNKKEVYDNVYMFLFKILDDKLLNIKDSVSVKINELDKKINMLEKDNNIKSLAILKQRLEIINNQIEEYNEKRNNLNYFDEYKNELEKKQRLTLRLNELEEKLQHILYEIDIIETSSSKLKKEKSKINVQKIKSVYDEANDYIVKINKNFEELLQFHNKMIENRIYFIEKGLYEKKEEVKKIRENIKNLINYKQKIVIKVLDEGLFDELNSINIKIEGFNIEKGEICQSIKLLEGAANDKYCYEEKRRKIISKLEPEKILNKISVFNKYFSELSEEIYGEKYIFAYNPEWKEKKIFPVSIDNFQGNVGTGKKKGIIVAFDLAYIMYCNELGIKGPKFVIHDKLENTHINQLRKIFEISNRIKGQYIVPILYEKINELDGDLIKKAKIIELSSKNKFFKI